jgi:soluble P-type ATPase
MADIPEEGNITDELRKLANIATDMQLSGKMRMQAINQLRDLGSHEALLIMLNLAANDKLNVEERDLALKKAREIVKKSPR